MKAKELTIVASRTFCGEAAGLPRYETLKVEAGLTFTIEEGDTAEAVRQRMIQEIRKSMSDTYRAFHPKYVRLANENRRILR